MLACACQQAHLAVILRWYAACAGVTFQSSADRAHAPVHLAILMHVLAMADKQERPSQTWYTGDANNAASIQLQGSATRDKPVLPHVGKPCLDSLPWPRAPMPINRHRELSEDAVEVTLQGCGSVRRQCSVGCISSLRLWYLWYLTSAWPHSLHKPTTNGVKMLHAFKDLLGRGYEEGLTDFSMKVQRNDDDLEDCWSINRPKFALIASACNIKRASLHGRKA